MLRRGSEVEHEVRAWAADHLVGLAARLDPHRFMSRETIYRSALERIAEHYVIGREGEPEDKSCAWARDLARRVL